MKIDNYLIAHAEFDWTSLMSEWNWLLPSEWTVWLMTRTGDLFIVLVDGTIHMLGVGAGTLSQAAVSRDEFLKRLNDPDLAMQWLMIPLVDALVASGQILKEDHCYSYRVLPSLGGSYDMDNFVILPIREHFGAWGSVQRQISDLPDGTEIVVKPKD